MPNPTSDPVAVTGETMGAQASKDASPHQLEAGTGVPALGPPPSGPGSPATPPPTWRGKDRTIYIRRWRCMQKCAEVELPAADTCLICSGLNCCYSCDLRRTVIGVAIAQTVIGAIMGPLVAWLLFIFSDEQDVDGGLAPLLGAFGPRRGGGGLPGVHSGLGAVSLRFDNTTCGGGGRVVR